MLGNPLLPQPGLRYTVWQPAGTYHVPGKGEFPQRFAPGAFDRSIGKIIPIEYRETDDGPVIAHLGLGRLVSAEVAEDGSGVSLTYEVVETAASTDKGQ